MNILLPAHTHFENKDGLPRWEVCDRTGGLLATSESEEVADAIIAGLNPPPAAPVGPPAKSQVTPSDSTETLPPAWAVKCLEALYDEFDIGHSRVDQYHGGMAFDSLSPHDKEIAAGIIAKHAPESPFKSISVENAILRAKIKDAEELLDEHDKIEDTEWRRQCAEACIEIAKLHEELAKHAPAHSNPEPIGTKLESVPPRSTPPIEGLVESLRSMRDRHDNGRIYLLHRDYQAVTDAITQLTQLQAEVARLKKEREEARELKNYWKKAFSGEVAEGLKHTEDILAERDRLRSALALAGEGQKKTEPPLDAKLGEWVIKRPVTVRHTDRHGYAVEDADGVTIVAGTTEPKARNVADALNGYNPNEKLLSAASEFIRDWRKGDFELPPLAVHDATHLESVLVECSSAALSVAPQKTQAIGCQEATNSKVEAAQPQKKTELSNDMTGTEPHHIALRNDCAKAVSGCAAVAEHDARVAEKNGLHGEQLETMQLYARKLRRAANLLNPGQAKSLAPLTSVSASNTNETGRFPKPDLI